MQEGGCCWGSFVLCGREGRTETWDISPRCGFWRGGLTVAGRAEGWRLGGRLLSCPTTRTCPRVAWWPGTSVAAPCESQPCGNFSSHCRLPSTALLPVLVFGLFLNPALRRALGCGGHFTITDYFCFSVLTWELQWAVQCTSVSLSSQALFHFCPGHLLRAV